MADVIPQSAQISRYLAAQVGVIPRDVSSSGSTLTVTFAAADEGNITSTREVINALRTLYEGRYTEIKVLFSGTH